MKLIISAELAVLKSSQYLFCGSSRQWDSNWERMFHDGMYKTDDGFLSNFLMERSCVMKLNRLAEDDQVFRSVCGKVGRQSSMVHIMVLLKFLGS